MKRCPALGVMNLQHMTIKGKRNRYNLEFKNSESDQNHEGFFVLIIQCISKRILKNAIGSVFELSVFVHIVELLTKSYGGGLEVMEGRTTDK